MAAWFLTLAILLVDVTAEATRCLECIDLPHPQFCSTVTTCKDTSECHVTQFISSGGLILYDSGCKDKMVCRASKRGFPVNKTSQVVRSSSTDIVTCVTCSDDDYSNIEGCGTTATRQPVRGPICFSCSVLRNPSSCRDVTTCEVGELCGIYRHASFPNSWTAGCVTGQQCNQSLFTTIPHGNTSASPCSSCCSDDFCNNGCSPNTTIMTPPPSAILTPTSVPSSPPSAILTPTSVPSSPPSAIPTLTSVPTSLPSAISTSTRVPISLPSTNSPPTTASPQSVSSTSQILAASTASIDFSTTSRRTTKKPIHTTEPRPTSALTTTGSFTTTHMLTPSAFTTRSTSVSSMVPTADTTLLSSVTSTRAATITTDTSTRATTIQPVHTTDKNITSTHFSVTSNTPTTSTASSSQSTPSSAPSTTSSVPSSTTSSVTSSVDTIVTSTIPSTTLIHPTGGSLITDKACPFKPVDIVFVLDGSGSESTRDFTTQLQFVYNITDQFEIGPNHTRISLLTFSTTVQNQFFLNEHQDKVSVLHRIGMTPYPDGETATHLALQFVANQTLAPAHDGRNVSTIVIVLTDGRSTQEAETKAAAIALKSIPWVTVMAIGVGHDVDQVELTNIASDKVHVFNVATFDTLHTLQAELTNATCNICDSDKSDVCFVLDSSGSIGDSNFTKELEFVNSLIASFHVDGDAHTQFCVITFSTYAYTDINLYTYSTREALMQNVLRIPYRDGETRTDQGIVHARIALKNRHHGARPTAYKVAIVVTDGHSLEPVWTASQANKLHRNGVDTFAVGVGSAVNTQELESIASDHNHVVTVQGFEQLSNARETLVDKICTKHPPA